MRRAQEFLRPKMKVLVVEDEPPACLALQRALNSLGHDVATAADGEEAWATLADRTVRLVVSDWRLPRLDGLEFCRRVRQHREDYESYITKRVGTRFSHGVCPECYLPPYSPDLNPIEQAFAKLKNHMRQAAARTLEDLQATVASNLSQFHSDHCRGFFRHARYGTF